ncbi:MAG: GDP-mannose 4,6-dehydratase [Methanomicrobiales archaeon]|jgi:GDP-4-dehydro-6-deoxy-D-mannose reductase
MRSILITGISGFVGGHLANYLHRVRPDVALHGMSRSAPSWDFISSRESLLQEIAFHAGDMQDASWVDATIQEIDPDAIIQLAAQSSVAESWKNPRGTVLNNLSLLLNVFEAVRQNDMNPRILNVGSSEIYGSVKEQDLPLRESHKVHAQNPYAVARLAQEQLAAIYSDSYHFPVVSTRSFNHTGPGQDTRFVVSSIAKQVAEIARGKRDPVLTIGDGSIIRDFLDVRDVVEAYLKLVERGRSGEVYNVCSGTGRKIADIAAALSSIAGISVQVRTSADLMRPADNPNIVGSNEKIRREIGWQPRVSFDESLRAIYDYWYSRV